MSRIGKLPIEIPEKVTVEIKGEDIFIKGPKGELTRKIHPDIKIEKEGNSLRIIPQDENLKKDRALWGLFRSLIFNMVKGVSLGFERKLEINGIGYKVTLEKNKLIFNVGFSHPIDFILPQGIEAKVEKNIISLSGFDKELLGQTAANIRKIKKPEPYKGKGIKYAEEVIRRKAGKTAKGSEK